MCELLLEVAVPRTSHELILQKSIVVQAGAGAGKTTSLVQRIREGSLQYLQTHQRLPRVVVTTFTRKATQEVRERLLREALDSNDPAFLRFVQSSSHLHISTLHGVFTKFLRAYGQVRGLTPLFNVLSSQEDLHLFKQAVRESLHSSSNQDLCQGLLVDFEMPQLHHMLEALVLKNQEISDLRPLSRLELEKALQTAVDDFVLRREDVLAALEEQELNKSWQEYQAVLRASDAFATLIQTPLPRRSPKMSEDFSEVWTLLKDALKRLQKWSASSDFLRRQVEQNQRLEQWAQNVRSLFENQKRLKNSLSQRDLETFTLGLLKEFPVLGLEFSQQWDYWMVDEYQDTSPLQVEILRHLMGDRASFTVGDPQQSLYLFRGARKEVFVEKVQDARKNETELRTLLHNHRSRPELVEIFNELLTPFSAFEKISAGRTASKSDSPSWALRLIHKDFPKGVLLAEKRAWEIEMALRQACHLQSLGHSVCILARKNDEILEIKKVAAHKKIRLQAQTPSALREQTEIQDALFLLRFALVPADNLNLMCLLKSPLMGWQESDWLQWNHISLWEDLREKPEAAPLRAFLENASRIGILEAWKNFLLQSDLPARCYNSDPSGQKLANFWKLLQVAHQKSREGASDFLRWLHQIQNPRESAEAENADAMLEMSLGSIQAMTVHASKGLQFDHVIVIGCGNHRASSSKSWVLFSEQPPRWGIALPDPQTGDRTVPLPAENWLEIKKHMELEEYDRILYVAATRAAETLSLIWSDCAPQSWAARWPRSWSGAVEILEEVDDFQCSTSAPILHDAAQPLSLTATATQSTKATEQAKVESRKADSWNRMLASLRGQKVHLALQNLSLENATNWLEKIQNPQLRELLFTGEREWAFQIQQEGGVLSGQIDLWGVTSEDELWVIDYKTGKNALSSSTWRQLSIYRNALVQIFPEYENLPWSLGVVQTGDMSLVQRKMQDFTGTLVFGDGAASGNPGPAGWGSIVYADGEVREFCGSAESATNNQMEIWAIIQGLKKARKNPISVYSDSTYVLQGITQWIWGWKKRNWVTAEGNAVANRDLWEELDTLVSRLGRKNIQWHYVRGHAGVPGNERCDEMAQAKAKGKSVQLYSGSLLHYSVALMDLPEDTSLPERKEQTKPKEKEKVWYLSEIGGEVWRHDTWVSCENRVKGRSGARFKKVKSNDEEAKVLASWNLTQTQIKG